MWLIIIQLHACVYMSGACMHNHYDYIYTVADPEGVLWAQKNPPFVH